MDKGGAQHKSVNTEWMCDTIDKKGLTCCERCHSHCLLNFLLEGKHIRICCKFALQFMELHKGKALVDLDDL